MRKLFTFLLSVVVVVSVSCNQPDYYTGVVIRKNHRLISRGRHVYGVVIICKDGGKMAGLADVEIRVPHFGYADRIQEIHIKVIHILMMLVEFEMAKEA